MKLTIQTETLQIRVEMHERESRPEGMSESTARLVVGSSIVREPTIVIEPKGDGPVVIDKFTTSLIQFLQRSGCCSPFMDEGYGALIEPVPRRIPAAPLGVVRPVDGSD